MYTSSSCECAQHIESWHQQLHLVAINKTPPGYLSTAISVKCNIPWQPDSAKLYRWWCWCCSIWYNFTCRWRYNIYYLQLEQQQLSTTAQSWHMSAWTINGWVCVFFALHRQNTLYFQSIWIELCVFTSVMIMIWHHVIWSQH